jgi:hypothetical protein
MQGLGAIGGAWILIGCSASKGTEPKHPASFAAIQSEADAKIAFAYLKAEAEQIDGQVRTNFAAPLSISGVNGSASVTGSKTSTSSSSSSSTYSSQSSDLNVSFAAFRSSASGVAVSGATRWTDYSDSRTACSISTCASSSHHSQSVDGSSIAVTYSYSGKTYSDRVTVDASRNNVSSFSVALTNGAGDRFSFYYP